jgi:uncharacterized membrane protein (DUF4010 family)
MTTSPEIFFNLGAALAIGLLIGVERGWVGREAQEGERVAGLRTYGLLGLLGGGTALLAGEIGMLFLAFAFVALAGVLVTVYAVNLGRGHDVGITSLVAALLTFIFGALAAIGQVTVAAAFAVLTTLLLGLKPVLHAWVRRLEERELRAGLKLLLISVVLLPVLPDQGYGPWQALNPYRIWWMVVLIAAISFSGYFAIKITGPARGAVYTGIFAGLASSTALTLHFSRIASRRPAMTPMLATGVLMACGTMFPRMLFLATLINPALFIPLAIPAAVMTTIVFVTALVYWRQQQNPHGKTDEMSLVNPLELKIAVYFGLFLAAIMLLGKALKEWVGDAGILVLAGVSGIADVDAITLSLSQMSHAGLQAQTVVPAIVLAAAVNSLVKGGIAAMVGGRLLGLRVAVPLLVASAGGLVVLI